ncbi:hypothetical protein ABT336_12095 [Micromonospora sp. NPDC000207]
MTAEVRSLAAQRDRNQRAADDRNLAEADRIRDGLTSSSSKQGNSRPR